MSALGRAIRTWRSRHPALRRPALVRLDAIALLEDEARRRTGLDDFGDAPSSIPCAG